MLYNQARDMTTVRITPSTPLAPGGPPALLAGTSFPGRYLTRPGGLLLGLQATGATWRFEGCHSMTLLVGGASLGAREITRDTQIGSGQLSEVVSILITAQEMNQLASASRVTVKLCSQEVTLLEVELGLIRRFMQEINKLSPR